MTWHQEAPWKKLCDLLPSTKKSTTNCFETMANPLLLNGLRHHKHIPSLPASQRSVVLADTQHYVPFTQSCDQCSRNLCHLLSTDQPRAQPHTHCSHGRLPNKNCCFMFTHLVCHYCSVSPRNWQINRLKGCLLVQSCSFQQDTYSL